jgi:hypothetical protein
VALWDRWVLAQTRQEACDRLKTAVMRPGVKTNKQTVERQFGGKTVLAGLRLKKQSNSRLKFLNFVLIYFHLFSVDHVS